MGFSISAATAIIGVTLVMALEVSLGTMIPLYTDIQESYHDMKKRSIEEIQTDLSIEQVNATVNASNHDVNITIKNTGSTTIESAYITILIDGEQEAFVCDSSYLYPESSYYLLVNGISGSGEKKIKIITANGISCYETYNGL